MILVTKSVASDVLRAMRLGVEPGTRFDIGSELDVFDVMDLKAFVGITRLAVKCAIRELTDDKTNGDDLISETE